MTVSATLGGVFLKGTAAARPAANAVAGGTVYSATDTGVITQSDGSSWSTWATISAGLADPMTTRGDIIARLSGGTGRLALGAAGKALVSDGTDIGYGYPGAVGCIAFNSAVQSVLDNTSTAMTLDSEDLDTDGFHSTSVNTSRMTIPTGLGGKFTVKGSTYGGGWNDSTKIILAFFKVNGTTNVRGAEKRLPDTSTSGKTPNITADVVLAAADYIEFFIYHNTTHTTDFGNTSTNREVQTTFSIMRWGS